MDLFNGEKELPLKTVERKKENIGGKKNLFIIHFSLTGSFKIFFFPVIYKVFNKYRFYLFKW